MGDEAGNYSWGKKNLKKKISEYSTARTESKTYSDIHFHIQQIFFPAPGHLESLKPKGAFGEWKGPLALVR